MAVENQTQTEQNIQMVLSAERAAELQVIAELRANRNKAFEIKAAFDRVETDAEGVKDVIDTEKIDVSGSQMQGKSPEQAHRIITKAKEVKTAVAHTILALQQEITQGKKVIIPDTITDPNREIIKKIAAIDTSLVNANNAAFIYPILKNALQNGYKSPAEIQAALFSLTTLKEFDIRVYQAIHRGLHQAAMRLGATTEQLNTLQEMGEEKTVNGHENSTRLTPEQEASGLRKNKYGVFREWGDGDTYIERMFTEMFKKHGNDRPKDFLKGISSGEEFKQYLKTLSKEIKKENETNGKPELGTEELGKEVSKRITRELLYVYSNIVSRLDDDRPRDFSENIFASNHYAGVGNAFRVIGAQLTQLKSEVKNEDLGFQLFTRTSETKRYEIVVDKFGNVGEGVPQREVTQRNHEAQKLKKELANHSNNPLDELNDDTEHPEYSIKPFIQRLPTKKYEAVNVAGFVHYLTGLAESQKNIGERDHDVTALMQNSALSEEGYYKVLNKLVGKISGTDIDEENSVEGIEYVLQAETMYIKFLTEAMASNDWRVNTAITTRGQNKAFTDVEEKVLQYMTKRYATKEEEWMLRRAVRQAVGRQRSIYMVEAAIKNWGDPYVKYENGKLKVNFANSVPQNGELAMNAFGDIIKFSSAEGTMLIFVPTTSSIDDPQKYFEEMNKFDQSYMNGSSVSRQELLLDLFINPGKIGPAANRGSWRMNNGYYGYFEDIEKKDKDVDFFARWKKVENIGLLALKDFAFSKGNLIKNEPLMNYLFEKYIQPTCTERYENYHEYLEKNELLREPIVEQIEERKKEGYVYANKKDEEEEIEKKLKEKFIDRVMVGIAALRVPTTFALLDRDREAKNGNRVWKLLRFQPPFKDTPNGDERFSEALNDIMFAESELRANKSAEIKENLAKGGKIDDETRTDFVLTEGKLVEYLQLLNLPEGRMDNAKAAYGLLKKYCNTNDTFLTQFTLEKLDPDKNKLPFGFVYSDYDPSLMCYSQAGEGYVKRQIGDIDAMKEKVVDPLMKLPAEIINTARSGKNDFGELVKLLKGVRDQMVNSQGEDAAYKLISKMSTVIVNSLKKTRVDLNEFVAPDKLNSLVAKLTGRADTWEWTRVDIDHFFEVLDKQGILPENGYIPNRYETVAKTNPWKKEQHKLGPIEWETTTFQPFETEKKKGIFGIGTRNVRKKDFSDDGEKVRERFNITAKQVWKEGLSKAAIALLLLALYFAFKEAMKKTFSK